MRVFHRVVFRRKRQVFLNCYGNHYGNKKSALIFQGLKAIRQGFESHVLRQNNNLTTSTVVRFFVGISRVARFTKLSILLTIVEKILQKDNKKRPSLWIYYGNGRGGYPQVPHKPSKPLKDN